MEENETNLQFHAFVRSVQKIVLYETKARFYVVGSNNAQTKFRVLKIDRTEPRELVVSDDRVVYSYKEIRDLLTMIDVGNRSKVGQKMGSGFNKTVSSYGIIGFVRFLEGYYILLITKRLRAAMLGHHSVYKIEDTAMVYIPNDEVREAHPDEQRYVKMFQAIDLSSNFYFGYSYDITNTVQHNLTNPSYMTSETKTQKMNTVLKDGQHSEVTDVSYVSQPNERYLWNSFLTQPVRNKVHHDWILNVIHGFVDQANISIYGTPILLTLIARRSNKFAGTRFLKRGSNFSGDVANEVETEQIVNDSSISSFNKANVTSFVQIRGSVPGHWSQDTSSMVPKPPIFFQVADPHARTAGRHFNQLMTTYGAPVVVLNLVKKRERKRKHEGLLSEYLSCKIDYLNTFLHEEFHIQYTHFDMARCQKREDASVMAKLAEIAAQAVNKTGIFHNQRPYYWESLQNQKKHDDITTRFCDMENTGNYGSKQTGIVRTNCVDCLDRTNTAQFVIAKYALGLQLYALGFLPEPHLEYDCDCSRMLEAMFEDHGDTLALQYGGSQLIHRIKSCRGESKWTSRANDITQTVRRYYSNALTDAEKQNTMNLFLGVFVPKRNEPAMWDKEAPNDTYLHLPELIDMKLAKGLLQSVCTQWWDVSMRKCLPFSLNERRKQCLSIMRYTPGLEPFDLYHDQYNPFALSVVSDVFAFKEVSHSVRDYMPNCSTDFSPFAVREREGKRREENSAKVRSSFAALLSWSTGNGGSNSLSSSSSALSVSSSSATMSKNPSVIGLGSSVANTSESDEEDLSSSDSFDCLHEITDGSRGDSDEFGTNKVTFEALFPSSKVQYGFELGPPSEDDMEIYRHYVDMAKHSMSKDARMTPEYLLNATSMEEPFKFFKDSDIKLHDYNKELLPVPSKEDMAIYEKYIRVGKTGISYPDKEDLDMYMEYVSQYKKPTQKDKDVYEKYLEKAMQCL